MFIKQFSVALIDSIAAIFISTMKILCYENTIISTKNEMEQKKGIRSFI